MTERLTLLSVLWLSHALLVMGCQHVAPYEREYLAKRSMDVGSRDMVAVGFESHVHEAREGAGGGGETSGGGCGCN